MGLMAAFFRLTLPGGTVIEPDAVIDLSDSLAAKATKSPIEVGARVSDHVIVEPRLISASLIFSASSLSGEALEPAGEARPGLAVALLWTAAASASTGFLELDGETISPVVISVKSTRTFADGDSRTVEIEIQQIQFATVSRLAVPVPGLIRSGPRKRKTRARVSPSFALAAAARFATGDYLGALGLALAPEPQ
jgi:hypothetical protein